MTEPYLQARLDALRKMQNPDGGWGYRAGKQSWLEPTLYCLLAFDAWDSGADSMARGLQYVSGLQKTDGSWRGCAHLDESHWATALCLNLALRRRQIDERFRRGLRWLVDARGSEGTLSVRLGRWLDPSANEFDPSLRGWTWSSGTSSWIEPTSHALIVLSKATSIEDSAELRSRVEEGRRFLLDRQCRDGGWNYGNRRVRGCDLPSYPETTAIALLALRLCGERSLKRAVDRAVSLAQEPSVSRLARAWLTVALRHDAEPFRFTESGLDQNVITTAMESIACSERGLS